MAGRHSLAVFVGAVALVVAACRSSSPPGTAGGSGAPPEATGAQRSVYVAVGASDSVGVGADRPSEEAWPVVLHRIAMPPGTSFVNAGISGATVAEALRSALPRALAERPTVATVWLNVNDVLAGVPPERFEQHLGELVRALRRGGATEVFVANTPRLDVLPAYRACQPASAAGSPPCGGASGTPAPPALRRIVDSYNEATARVARREGAVLVDLHGASASASRDGSVDGLVSADGFHPSTAGHRAVAEVFARALREAGVSGA